MGVSYARHIEVLWRSTSRGPVLLAPNEAMPARLGGIAAAVWEVLDAPMSVAEVAAEVDTITGHAGAVQDGLDALVARGLVRTVP